MSLTLLWITPAFAARVYWAAPPSDEERAAVARTVPEATMAPLDTLGGVHTATPDEVATLATLRAELAACRPLVDVFDGELQIMARLAKATDDVTVLRSAEDRALLFDALVFEGFAVHRYFQDRLGTEPAAAPYRVGTGPDAHVAPWMAAAALLDAPTPSATMLPEAAQRVAYDEVQASVRTMPSASVVVGTVARGAEVFVDGRKVESAAATRVLVVPGRHYVEVRAGDVHLLHEARTLAAGESITLTAPFGPAEQAALATLVATDRDGWSVPAGAREVLAGEPTYVAMPGGRTPRLLRVDTGVATEVRVKREESGSDNGAFARVSAGVGWASTGDWFLQNVDAGAPYDNATVNALAPSLSTLLGYRAGLLVAGAGLDVSITPGDWHTLPSGDQNQGAWFYPHAAVGVPWAQVTVGFESPWYVGLGAQAEVPIVGPLGVFGKGVYGVPVARSREDGPTFEPLPAYLAWGGLSLHFGK